MTKEYYQILGVSENTPLEEIKKSYRKLAQQWHPDKWNTKSLEEREKANEKMQKLNKAYEILGDAEKRKRYDAGETSFSYDATENFDWQSYFDAERTRLNTEAEKIRFKLEALAYGDVMNIVGFEMTINEVYSDSLDNKLWTPYGCWQEKVINLKVIIDENVIDKVNSSLYKFQEEMINAIRKRKEELDNGINDPYVNQARTSAIESIENFLTQRGLKVVDLPVECQNYQEQINSLTKVWKIRDLRDEIKEVIKKIDKQQTYEQTIQPTKNEWFKSFRGFWFNNC
jgi:curved DNA-binding protein CbpA